MSLIYEKINEVMSQIGAIDKTRKNEAQGYKFRGIEDIYNAVHPILVKSGVFCVPQVVNHETSERVGKTGTISLRVMLTVCHKFYAADGSFVDVITVGEGMDTSDKASNKAMSAAMKYAYVELLALPYAEVEDGDKTSPEAGKANGAMRTTEPLPLKSSKTEPEKPEYIDSKDAQKLHIRFANALNEDIKAKADEYLYAFLKLNKFVDAEGKPSASMIPKEAFKTIGPAAIAHAQELNNAKSEEQ